MSARVIDLDEARGNLSPSEQALLPTLSEAQKVIPFRVTVATPDKTPAPFRVIASDSCEAVIQVLAILFPDPDAPKPAGLSISVVAIKPRLDS